jgi:hypothetical protein
MQARLLRLALIASLFCSLGGHLALLQGWAWAKMASRGQRVDGSQPCEMCLKIKRNAGAEAAVSAPVRSVRASLSAPSELKFVGSRAPLGESAVVPPSIPQPAPPVFDPPPPRSLLS